MSRAVAVVDWSLAGCKAAAIITPGIVVTIAVAVALGVAVAVDDLSIAGCQAVA